MFELAPTLTGRDVDLHDVYFSFDAAPLDPSPLDEGDDSIHVADVGAGYAALDALRTTGAFETGLSHPAGKAKAIAPYPGVIRLKPTWTRGPAVEAYARALWRSGAAPFHVKGGPFRRAFGKGMRDDVIDFCHAYNLKHAKAKIRVDGVADEAVFRAMVPWFDARALSLLVAATPSNPLAKAQARFLGGAMAGYNYRGRIHYTQGPARMYLTKRHVKDPAALANLTSIWEDCSSWFTWLCFMAGVADPNGRGYDGLGYTGTLAQNGRHLWLADLKAHNVIGAAYLYGGGPTYSHVAGAVSLTRAISHGSEPGPIIVERGYRTISAVHVYKGLGY